MLRTKIRRIKRALKMRRSIPIPEIDFDNWFDTFEPLTWVDSHFGLFLKYFKKPLPTSNPKYGRRRLWTYISENGQDYLVTGYHTVNAISYVYTKKPWYREYIVKIR